MALFNTTRKIRDDEKKLVTEICFLKELAVMMESRAHRLNTA